MNRVDLIGRFTANPELRYTTNNKAYTRFSIAVNRNRKDENGNREADFISCVAWEGTAETICKYFEKGNRIGISGRIQTGSYDAQDGTKRYTTDVVVDNFTFIGSGSGANTSDIDNGPSNDIATTDISDDPFKDFGDEVALSDDDLPF